MIKKTGAKSLFADSPEDIAAEKFKQAQAEKKKLELNILPKPTARTVGHSKRLEGTRGDPSGNNITTEKSRKQNEEPIEVSEFGFLKKKKGRKTADKIQIFIRDNPSTCEELTSCMKKFGITTQHKYCFLKNLYFVLVPEALSRLLNIDMTAILRNAEIGLHFIQLQTEEIFASKYGLVQMIAASKEPISIKFQDYVFELIHKIEENGEVKVGDLQTRQVLMDEIDANNNGLHLFEMQYQLQDTQKAYHALDADYGIVMDQLQIKTNLLEKAEIEIKELTAQNRKLREIAEALGKYVKISKTTETETTKGVYEALEGMDISVDLDDGFDKREVHADAVLAKKRLRANEKKEKVEAKLGKNVKIAEYMTLEQHAHNWSILRSLYPSDQQDHPQYTWKLLQNVKDTFKEVSAQVLKDLENGIFEEPITGILLATPKDVMLAEILSQGWVWYDDVTLTELEVKMLQSIFAHQPYLTEQFVCGLFH